MTEQRVIWPDSAPSVRRRYLDCYDAVKMLRNCITLPEVEKIAEEVRKMAEEEWLVRVRCVVCNGNSLVPWRATDRDLPRVIVCDSCNASS